MTLPHRVSANEPDSHGHSFGHRQAIPEKHLAALDGPILEFTEFALSAELEVKSPQLLGIQKR